MLKGVLRVRERFTVTLTREVRKALGIKVGQRLEAIVQDDRIILRPLPENPSKLSSVILREARMSLNQIRETALSEAEREAEQALRKKMRAGR
jgi:bifunctional DNA-binding transcriptional regulator/antitoxin component of YhaV-PrlF toxin-antitoxin module